jgi:hypothetical protein
MLTTTNRAIQGRLSRLLNIPKLAAGGTQLSRPTFIQIRHGSAVPGRKDPDNMGGPGGQESMLDSAALRR